MQSSLHSRHLHSVDYDEPLPSHLPPYFEELLALVGDAQALADLDGEPLPDEPFAWANVEPRDRDFVQRVLSLSDQCCDELLDVEFRTIARRILARVAARDPRALRRSTNAERCAAGLVWLAGRANGEFGRRGMRLSHRLWSWFGMSSCSERGRTLRAPAGLEPERMAPYAWDSDRLPLGDPSLLHSRFRAQLIMRRDALSKLAPRRKWSILEGGRHAQIDAAPVKCVVAAKGVVGERVLLLMALGETIDDADLFALTIPQAHDLVRMVERALNAPAPS